MYPASPGLRPRLVVAPATGTKQRRGELCDAVLHGVDALALFEIKGSIIPDQHVLDPDPSIFRAEVIKRYASPGSKGTRRKGVTQLSRAIKAVSTGEARLDSLRQGVTIYPVLITFDDLIEAPGTLHIIRNAFASELSTTTDGFPIDLNGLRVAQLTIMTVSDVELLDWVVETTELLEVLRRYTTTAAGRPFRDYLAENQHAFGIQIHGRQVTELATAASERARTFRSGEHSPATASGDLLRSGQEET